MTIDEKHEPACYASPPCLMHELDPAYGGIIDTQQRTDVMRWRKAERHRLIAERLAMSDEFRREADGRIAALLEEALGDVGGQAVGAYWPVRGEPDLREFMARIAVRGAQCALPAIGKSGAPMTFLPWAPGEPSATDDGNTPVPSAGREVVPDIVIVPVVGFDRDCHRLGYGDGALDHGLAALSRKPRLIGVGYAQAAIPTIYPQPHDIPMELIVTENGIVTPQRDGEAAR
jgi:5,10-methenyltetrahydrofolate synthetase